MKIEIKGRRKRRKKEGIGKEEDRTGLREITKEKMSSESNKKTSGFQ